MGDCEAVSFLCDRQAVNLAKPGTWAVNAFFCSARQVSRFPGES
jgi:hypothetical protein